MLLYNIIYLHLKSSTGRLGGGSYMYKCVSVYCMYIFTVILLYAIPIFS